MPLHAALYFDRNGDVTGAAVFAAEGRMHGDERLKRRVLAHGPVCDVAIVQVFRGRDRCVAEYQLQPLENGGGNAFSLDPA